MYLRETRRTNRDGSVVSYLQLAHNERHPVRPAPDREGDPQLRAGRPGRPGRRWPGWWPRSPGSWTPSRPWPPRPARTGVQVLDSRRLGGAWTLDRLWERLGIGAAIRRVAAGRRLDGEQVERVVFALVAQRALEPGSKLAATRWVAERVAIDGLAGLSDDQAYRAMDFLLEALDEIAARDLLVGGAPAQPRSGHRVRGHHLARTGRSRPPTQLADLADAGRRRRATTSPAEAARRTFGHSKDHRDDLPQVVIAMAVTRDGIPVRCWTFPGDTADTGDHPPDQGRPRRVGPAPAGVGGRPRVRLRRQPGLPDPRRRALHPRREAAPHQHRGRRRAGPTRPLPHRRGQPAGQGSPRRPRRGRRRRRRRPHPAVRGLPQPGRSRTGPAGPGQPGRPPAAADRRLRHLDAAAPRRAGRLAQGQAGAAPLPAPHPRPGCCASTTPRSAASHTWTASGCCAPPTSPSPPTTSPPPTSSCSPSNAAGGT